MNANEAIIFCLNSTLAKKETSACYDSKGMPHWINWEKGRPEFQSESDTPFAEDLAPYSLAATPLFRDRVNLLVNTSVASSICERANKIYDDLASSDTVKFDVVSNYRFPKILCNAFLQSPFLHLSVLGCESTNKELASLKRILRNKNWIR